MPAVAPGTLQAEAPRLPDLAVDKAAIKPAIYEHPEFVRFIGSMAALFTTWCQQATATLKNLQTGCHPKQVIHDLAEGLLAHYQAQPLIDAYDVYQHLMDYWAQTMQDDCYLVAADGWKAEPTRVLVKNAKGKEVDKGWVCDLVPKGLVVARYFAKEQTAITVLQAELESVAARMAELEQEHGGDEGAFAELDKVNKAHVAARLKEIKGDKEARDEAAVLGNWLTLANEEADTKKALRQAEDALDAKALARYPKLTEAEVKTLVVEDKWMAALDAAIHGEMDRISQALTQRVKELAERYAVPLPELTSQVVTLSARVDEHLKKMGLAWS